MGLALMDQQLSIPRAPCVLLLGGTLFLLPILGCDVMNDGSALDDMTFLQFTSSGSLPARDESHQLDVCLLSSRHTSLEGKNTANCKIFISTV